MSNCKAAACGAPIQWARNVETGKGMPLDPAPVSDGNVIIVDAAGVELRSGEWPIRVLKSDEAPPAGALLYQAHFRSCVDADSFRTDRAGQGKNRARR